MRRRRWLWVAIPAAVVLVGLPVGAVVAVDRVLTPETIRAEAQRWAARTLGRNLVIAGPIRIEWGLSPTLVADDIRLSNPPGTSRASMVHVARLEATLSLLSLLSDAIDLPRVRLDRPELWFERSARGAPNWVFSRPAPPSDPTPSAVESGAAPARRQVVIDEVDVTGGQVGWVGPTPVVVTVPSLTARPRSGQVDGTLALRDVPFRLTGTVPPAGHLALRLDGGGIAATFDGAALHATMADFSAASALAGHPLPPLRDLALDVAVATGAWHLTAGATDWRGFHLTDATLEAQGAAGPATLTARGTVGGVAVSITGRSTALGGTAPIDWQAAAGTVANIEGSVVPGRLPLAVAWHATIPDLAALGAAANVPLPRLTGVTASGKAAITAIAVSLADLSVTSDQGDLSGALSLSAAGRPTVNGTLSSHRLDVTALAPPPSPQAPPSSVPTTPPPPPARLVPDTPIPFATLAAGDADLTVSVDELAGRGWTLQGVAAHLVLAGGTLTLDPAGFAIGDHRVEGQVTATADTHAITLRVAGAGLPLPGGGTLDVTADLHGQGATVHEVAASLDGTAGLAIVDATIPRRWIESFAGATGRALGIGAAGEELASVRCLAVRADATTGKVEIPALALDTKEVSLSGHGDVSLGDEAITLHLRPSLRVGTTLGVPIQIGGTLRAPKVAIEVSALRPGRYGLTIGGPPPADPCGPALAAARNGAPGPSPSTQAPAEPVKPADLLRGLLR